MIWIGKSVCTDGGRLTPDRHGGSQALIRLKAPHAIWTCYIIHREALVSKSMSTELILALECAIDLVNYMKTRSLKTGLFKKLHENGSFDLYKEILTFYCKKVMQTYILPNLTFC